MELLIFLSVPALIMCLIQLGFCFNKDVVIKLMPAMIPVVLLVWYSINERQRTDGPIGCGMGAAIMSVFLGTLFAGVVLGWIVYAVIWIFGNKK